MVIGATTKAAQKKKEIEREREINKKKSPSAGPPRLYLDPCSFSRIERVNEPKKKKKRWCFAQEAECVRTGELGGPWEQKRWGRVLFSFFFSLFFFSLLLLLGRGGLTTGVQAISLVAKARNGYDRAATWSVVLTSDGPRAEGIWAGIEALLRGAVIGSAKGYVGKAIPVAKWGHTLV